MKLVGQGLDFHLEDSMDREEAGMLWGPDDWDDWALREPTAQTRSLPGEQALVDVIRRVPGRRSKTVADLGCGRGALLPFLATHFGRVVAVDYAPRSLAIARRACEGMGVVFRRRDLRDLTPFHGALHVAVAAGSISGPRLADVDRILAEVYQSLTEGGMLAATFPAASSRGDPIPVRLGRNSLEPRPWPLHEVELQYRLRRAGFQGVRIRRFSGQAEGADALLCIATRRGNN